MGNKNTTKEPIGGDEEEGFYLEDWEIVNPNNLTKKKIQK